MSTAYIYIIFNLSHDRRFIDNWRFPIPIFNVACPSSAVVGVECWSISLQCHCITIQWAVSPSGSVSSGSVHKVVKMSPDGQLRRWCEGDTILTPVPRVLFNPGRSPAMMATWASPKLLLLLLIVFQWADWRQVCDVSNKWHNDDNAANLFSAPLIVYSMLTKLKSRTRPVSQSVAVGRQCQRETGSKTDRALGHELHSCTGACAQDQQKQGWSNRHKRAIKMLSILSKLHCSWTWPVLSWSRAILTRQVQVWWYSMAHHQRWVS